MPLSTLRNRLGKLIFGSVIARTEDDQKRVDQACHDLVLYHFPSCPFCIRVRRALRRMSLKLECRDIRRDAAAFAELREQGGKSQVPCLRIELAGKPVRWLYESADIVRYLEKRFPTP